MNFFEGELRKIIDGSGILENASYVGRACFGDIGKDLRARIEFSTNGYADRYSSLRMTIINRKSGAVDMNVIRLEELLGMKAVPGNPNFQNGVSPYIWVYKGMPEWYAFKPSQGDYLKMRKAVGSYVEVFRSFSERGKTKPSLKAQVKKAETVLSERGKISHGFNPKEAER